MKHFIAQPRVIPKIYGDNEWRTPFDFLLEGSALAKVKSLPDQYVKIESELSLFARCCFSMLVHQPRYRYLYLHDFSEEHEQASQQHLLFESLGASRANACLLIEKSSFDLDSVELFFKLYLRDLGRVSILCEQTQSVVSDTNSGLSLFLSIPDRFEVSRLRTPESIELIECDDLFEDEAP